MTRNGNSVARAGTALMRKLYWAGIAVYLLIALSHFAYAFIAYESLTEPALWFWSGGLSVVFSAGLNMAYIDAGRRLSFALTAIANLTLLAFCIALVIVTGESHTVFVMAGVLYTTIVCLRYESGRR